MTADWQVLVGDVREMLRTLPDESIQTCVTSPPYWGLRDYGTGQWEGGDAECDHSAAKYKSRYDYALDSSPIQDGSRTGTDAPRWRDKCPTCGARRIDNQIGLEATPDEYVQTMVQVFREVWRVLRPDGTLWLNLGDSYVGALSQHRDGGSAGHNSVIAKGTMASIPTTGRVARNRAALSGGLKPKDLVGIPWRVAFALQADGWWLRSDIIWHKPNPMPESVTDRPTKAHEYIFLLTKAERYFYDAVAIAEPVTVGYAGSTFTNGKTAAPHRNVGQGPRNEDASTRNKRTVWTVATKSFPDAHFATFPPKLIEPCILAGTSERGCCAECGAPWERVVEVDKSYRVGPASRGGNYGGVQRTDGVRVMANGYEAGRRYPTEFKGWQPTCTHTDAPTVPCTVLDPFSGAGTTGLVALQHGRSYVGVELNEEYAEMSRRRILGTQLRMPLELSA